MLVELKVRDFAIIDELQISFQKGLNILSGETGAGKSVILKSLALLMGEKSSADTVRTGKEQACVEGLFDLSRRQDVQTLLAQHGVELADEDLVVKRLVSNQGKSKVYLNGQLCPLNMLREIVSPLITVTGHAVPLIELTGQHDNRHLQSKSYHLDLLDRYAGCWSERTQFTQYWQRLQQIHQELQQLQQSQREREQRLDYLNFQYQEIAALNLQPGEEQDLEQQLSRLKNVSRLQEFTTDAEATLYSAEQSALVNIHHVLQRLQELRHVDPDLVSKLSGLQQAKALIDDTVLELRDYLRTLDLDPQNLQNIEERLSQIRKLQKKHGATISEILQTQNRLAQEIATLQNSDESIIRLQNELLQLQTDMQALAAELHERRHQGGLLLEKSVNAELRDLKMNGVSFSVQVALLQQTQWESCPSTGLSDVEFMIRASTKDEPRPLAKIASGGELSRILLALKIVVGSSDHPRTFLFDEVDAGVSGQAAEKVGRKLKSIAHDQQVICVTHLPQVACFADAHFLIEKAASTAAGQRKMTVTEIKKTERVREIARLISGEKITQTSLDHAKQLLQL